MMSSQKFKDYLFEKEVQTQILFIPFSLKFKLLIINNHVDIDSKVNGLNNFNIIIK